MRRLFAIIVLCAVASFPLNLGAQVRRGPHRGGVSPRVGAVIATGRPAPVVAGRPAFSLPRVRPPFVIQPTPFYEPFFSSAPIYPAPVYTAMPYVAAPYYSAREPTIQLKPGERT